MSTLDVHPNDYYTLRILMYCANTPERCKVGIEGGKKIATLTKSKAAQGMLGVIYARMGERDRALEIVRQLEAEADNEPAVGYYVALTRCTLGEKDEAIEWLERAEQSGLGLLIVVAVEPSFSPLRPVPRFQALLRKLGLA